MLTMKRTFKQVVLIGSTSEIGLSILNALEYSESARILLVGRTPPEQFSIVNQKVEVTFQKCDLENFQDIEILASKLSELEDIDLAIMSSGYLPLENQELNLSYVHKSMMINSVGAVSVLSVLANQMHKQDNGLILHISTVASIQPRLRNFTYGASKSGADFFARGLARKYRKTKLKIFVLRPGFVRTKLTHNFRPAPFAISKEELANIVTTNFKKQQSIFYAPTKLRLIMNIFRHLPSGIRDILSR
jgi:decaprenylphospho-beta-D-erythro-pentofuranosid-2-ulose 2-reductase